MPRGTRVTGHGLRHEGQKVYDQHGHYVGVWLHQPTEKRYGKCACGELFDEPSMAAVKRAHRAHKDEKRAERHAAALKALQERQNGGAA